MKYLETNALRKHASRLMDDDFVIDKYTSILSLLELISGINNNDSFRLRSSIIKKVSQSKIKIDTILPELKIFNAFGFDLNNYDISDKVGQIIKLVELTKDFGSLMKTIQTNSLNDAWIFIKQYDENANTEFKNAVLKRFQNSDIKQLISQFELRWSSDNFNHIKNKVIDYYASIILKSPYKGDKSIEDIISAYNNSIDIYLITTTYYLDEKISFKNMPGKNDYLDLNHLMYLNGRFNQIVSDDNLLYKIMSKTFPENILKTNEI